MSLYELHLDEWRFRNVRVEQQKYLRKCLFTCGKKGLYLLGNSYQSEISKFLNLIVLKLEEKLFFIPFWFQMMLYIDYIIIT